MLDKNNKFFCLVLFGAVFSQVAISEDIEIYTSAVGADEESTINPNVLFIIDTSTSMQNTVPVLVSTDEYDPDTDYGGNDDYIYIYDELGAYTNQYFTDEQNKCQAALDKFSATPESPIYVDRGLQWRCIAETGLGSSGVTVNGSGTVNRRGGTDDVFAELSTSLLESGKSISLQVGNESATQTVQFSLQEYVGWDWGNVTGCSNKTAPVADTATCELETSDIDASATDIRVYVYADDSTTNRDWYGSLTYNIAPSQVEVECGTADVQGSEWYSDLTTSPYSSSILECQGDSGLHNDRGEYDAATNTEVYVAPCPGGTCDDPYYVSLSGNEIDWSNESFPTYQFYSGNYHNYLQSGGGFDLSDLDLDGNGDYTDDGNYGGMMDKDDYCRSSYQAAGNSSMENMYVTHSDDGLVYECQTLIEVATNAAIDVASQQAGVNVGLMIYNGGEGGLVINAVDDVATNLTTFTETASSLFDPDDPDASLTQGTPLAETFYEAYLYLSGLNAEYGSDGTNSSLIDAEAFSSGSISVNGAYETPIVNACQSNNIIYLSDGEPFNDGNSDSDIESISGIGSCGPVDDEVGSGATGATGCLDDLAGYMAGTDLVSNADVEGNNTVNSYFIGFNETLEVFDDAAAAARAAGGSGAYYEADSYGDLLDAFEQILVNIAVDAPTTLVAPAVSVNAFNELQHRDQIYYAIFEPTLSPRWQGNVKKFSIDGSGTVMDQNGDVAVDTSTGFFMDSSQSYWSDLADGGEVDKGGFTEQLAGGRSIYVDASTVSGGTGIAQLTGSSSIDTNALGVSTEAEAGEIRDWFLGVDIPDHDNDGLTTDTHNYAGDPLHSKPFVITYSGTSVDDANDVLFVTTNLGMLHAVDASTGDELWAYIPEDVMGNAKIYLDDNSSDGHAYGLDGEAAVWTIEDTSADNFALKSAYMYQGMRRGGSNYYAWDISNANSSDGVPISEMWQIKAGETAGFDDMGQTWSKMIRTRMAAGCGDGGSCEVRDVLVFAGGYDEYYDNKDNLPKTASSDIQGNAIYIVDAVNGWDSTKGGFIYKIGDGDSYNLNLPMYNSIPADPSPIDIDGDGVMDMLFFVDIAGHVWRVDFDKTLSTSSESYASGGMIADLYDGLNFRRFYNALDISLVVPQGSDAYLNLSVGSGYRSYPKDDESWTNALFMIFDENTSGPATDTEGNVSYAYKEEEDTTFSVVDIYDLYVWSSTEGANKSTNAPYGFYRQLDGVLDEKMLQSSITFNGYVLFSSYIPTNSGEEATCGSGEIGSGRTYLLDLETGDGALEYDTDGDGDIDGDDNDTYLELAHEGIPPEATILMVPELVVCVGTECTDEILDFQTGQAERLYWREEK